MDDEFTDVFADALDAVPDDQFDESRFVPGAGPLDADVVLVGEAPGAQEVEEGVPFVGNAGRRLDSLLDDVGVDRDDLYLTNLVKVRPPENRDPHVDEVEAWRPVLDAELDRVDPDVVVTLGSFASRELLDVDDPVSDLRGDAYDRDGYVVRPTFHPAATFYDESKRADIESDLRAAFDAA